jgi:uncharacterized membrane protein
MLPELRSLPVGTKIVAGAFGVSGVIHLVRPQVFEPLVPRRLPARRQIVYASGVAELASAIGLVTQQPWAPATSAALLLAVWPGNWTMALAYQRSERVGALAKVAVWVRIPVQVPLIVAAWRSPTR